MCAVNLSHIFKGSQKHEAIAGFGRNNEAFRVRARAHPLPAK
jgi:hypothetical protein